MRILGQSLSGWGIPFISATARHGRDGSQGEVVCETQEQCDAIAARAVQEGWTITTRVVTADESRRREAVEQDVVTAHLTEDEIRRAFAMPDERLAALPLVSTHDEPQVAPQEYECGCVTVTLITDCDYRRGERPFEMRLAKACGTGACELAQNRADGVP